MHSVLKQTAGLKLFDLLVSLKSSQATMIQATSFGPLITSENVIFRLWAPSAKRVELLHHQTHEMRRSDDSWFKLTIPGARPGDRYRFRIDGETEVPDPASRFQPDDVHGPSEVIDQAL